MHKEKLVAKANPVRLGAEEPQEKKDTPKIEYYGEGAKDVKFEVDPRAALIRVYANGVVLVDY